MPDWRNQVIFLAIGIAESVILVATLGVIGLSIGLGGSPMPWSTLLLLYIVGLGASWVAGGLKGGIMKIALWYGTIGLSAIYLSVATTRIKEGFSFDLYWIYHLFNRDLDTEEIVAVFISVIAAVVVWRRTSRIMRDDRDAPDHLKRVFKFGLAVLAVALIVDEFADNQTGIALLLLPYFVATLAGMAVARLPTDSPIGGRWSRIIIVSLSIFIGIGMVAGYAGGRFGGTGLSTLFALWGWIVDAVLWVLRWPLMAVGWIIGWIVQWLQSFFNAQPSAPEEQQGPGERPEFVEREALQTADSAWVEAVLEFLQWPLTFLLLLALLLILTLAYKRIMQRISANEDAERESIRDEVDELSYWDLLKGLLPSWMNRRGNGLRLWRYPDDAGIREVFMLYFETIEQSIKQGMAFNPYITPNERRDEMALVLHGAPVAEITARFNAACYGNVPSHKNEIELLRTELLGAVKALEEQEPKGKGLDPRTAGDQA